MTLYQSQAQPIPMYETGTWIFRKAFDPMLMHRLVDDPPLMARVEAELVRSAHLDAAEHSLTVLEESPPRWTEVEFLGSVCTIQMTVRHEPQTDDTLIYAVAQRIAQDRDLWGQQTMPSPPALAQAAVRAVRDLGRLTAAAPRPEGLPE